MVVLGTGSGANIAGHQVQLFQAEQLDKTVADLRSQRDVQYAQHPQLRPEAHAVAVMARIAGGAITKADDVQAIEMSDAGDIAAAGRSGLGGSRLFNAELCATINNKMRTCICPI